MSNKYQAALDALKDAGNFRKLTDMAPHGVYAEIGGKSFLNLSSNDYLGLAGDRELQEAFLSGLDGEENLFGAASSRLLSGNHPAYHRLESLLCERYQKEACLIFNSGYHANIGILPALTDKKDLILADKLVHASIIDGIRLAEADFLRYRHLDYEHLETYLKNNRHKYNNVFIVTESIFSMDGDLADLNVLADLKTRYDAFLYVDEAHAFGVRGSTGLGLAEEQSCIDKIDFLVGTFGKAIASVGAFVVCTRLFRDYLVNYARPFIFTTALPQINVLWTEAVIWKLPEFAKQREHLDTMSRQLRADIRVMNGVTAGESHIVPFIVGENEYAIRLSEHLKEIGYLCMPIRYPTVPKGTARLRFSLSAKIQSSEIKNVAGVLSVFNKEPG